jgi:glycosyltransferase involved in cell wall biosynthesis
MFNNKKRLFSDFNKLKIVTPSKWLANRVQKSFLKDKDTLVIHNGIDTKDLFYPREFGHLKEKLCIKDEKIVLAVAPNLMSEGKGGQWVLKLAKIPQNKKIKFILIGVDVLSQKFDENVIAIGRISNQIELAEYYSMADIFIICSRRENFPTTCIEALSCGTPVIGFDEGGTRETAPGMFGLFVPYGDIDSLNNELQSFLTGKSNLKSKNECADYAKKSYSKQIMYKSYLDLYSK